MKDKTLKELKKEFIVDSKLDFWQQKKDDCEKRIKEWVGEGIKVAVIKNQVVNIFNSDDLSTEEMTEITKITEMWLNAEFMIECLKDNLEESVSK
jgi:hypothetical protein